MTVLRSALNVVRGQSSWSGVVRRALLSALVIAGCLIFGNVTTSDTTRNVIEVLILTTAFDFGFFMSQQRRARRQASH